MKQEKLGNCCNIDMGQAPDGNSYNENNEGLPLIAGAGDFGDYYPNAKKHTSKPTKISKINDIILCIRATIGDVNWSDKKYCLGRGVAGLRADKSKLDQNYLWHFISSNKEQLASQGTGSTFKQVSKNHIYNWEIPLPDLPTQTKIAQILDKADQIRQKRKKAIELADEFLRSLFLEMFGDPVVNPKGWKTEELKNFTEFENGDRSSNYPSGKDLLPSGIPFLSTKNINSDTYSEVTLNYISEGKFNSLSRGKVNNGDILITLRGTLASCCIFNSKYERAFINAQMMIIRTNKTKISNDFLHSLLTFSTVNYKLKNLGQGAAVPQLTAKQLQEFKVIIPPLEKQNTFLNIKRKISDLKNKIESSKTDELFNSLSQQYFAKVE